MNKQSNSNSLYRWHGGSNDKLNLPVATDETLQIGHVRYTLQAIIVHRGITKNSGHYLSIVSRGNRWISCDDDKVQLRVVNEMHNQLVLFYSICLLTIDVSNADVIFDGNFFRLTFWQIHHCIVCLKLRMFCYTH